MTGPLVMGLEPVAVKAIYVGAFLLAALLTLAALTRIGEVDDVDTRRGLAYLLAGSGIWAASNAGFLLAPSVELSIVFHSIGLVVGLGTVGAWLYFASAYTGRTFHRNRTLRWVAVGAFLLVVVVKVTNPVHGYYYSVAVVEVPFEHVAIQNGLLHWSVMGASYALSAIGYFMLFERFGTVSLDTKPLMALVTVTGLPILFDIAGIASEALIDIVYEPLGVAVFAAGFFFVFLDRFQAVRIAGERTDPVVALDEDSRVHQYNRAAGALFEERLSPEAIGQPIHEVFPELPTPDPEGEIFEIEGENRYYRVTSTPFTSGDTPLGKLLVFTDVTDEERAKRELKRQNERLERFTSTVSHDLRNPLAVAKGRLQTEEENSESEHVHEALVALERMETMIEDLLELARHGQPVDDVQPLSLKVIAQDAWEMVETDAATLEVTEDVTIEADPDRVASLFENLFRNAVEHAGEDVSVTVVPTETGFAVADDGPGIPPEDRETVLESGYTTAEDGSGFGLAIVSEVAVAHDWSLRVEESAAGGARFVFDVH